MKTHNPGRPLETDSNAAPSRERLDGLPARLRTVREERGWTLQSAAQRAQVSVAHLSRIETGERQPSIATLVSLATSYDVPTGVLLGDRLGGGPDPVIRGKDAQTRTGNGLIFTSLSRIDSASRLQALKVVVMADRPRTDYVTHPGEEWIYVQSGSLVLDLDGQAMQLAVGDAAQFDATTPHLLAAANDTDAEILLVVSQASFPVSRGHQ